MMFTKIFERLQRSARDAERLHLEVDQVRTLIASPLYALLAELHAQELSIKWQDNSEPSDSETIGLNTDPIETSGSSAGIPAQVVRDAENRRALATVTLITRQLKHKPPLPTPSQPNRNPTPLAA